MRLPNHSPRSMEPNRAMRDSCGWPAAPRGSATMAVEAVWNDQVIAHSDKTVVVEGNHYFPPDAVDSSLLEPSATITECPWKGTAHYYTLELDGERLEDA